MNAVEIEAAISELALEPFDAAEFPFAFLAAFGNKDTTLKRLRTGNNNASDVPGGVLLRNNIHIAVGETGSVGDTLKALRASLATTKARAKFILVTDGQTLEAEALTSGETIACAYADFPNHFGFFLPLAGISTIKEITDNPIDVRATGRLNKLYVELLSNNPDWAKDERRADMNHFMARLVFCFFAEDTDIFNGEGLFTQTVTQFSEPGGGNTHTVLSEIFRAMNIKVAERAQAEVRLPGWADQFPYVNGGLFSGSTEVPHFTRMARTYLLHAGNLNWKQINPDIFGSMIQAVADDEERGALGMHYTSVPNILKVLNPLFLDDLRAQLDAAGDNRAKLLNLRKRMALIIAEFQCDVLHRGQKDALAEFLPLNAQNWIVCGNALRLDWLSVCPPTGTGVKMVADDLFGTPLDQAEIDFENEGGETFICGNPPYLGSTWQAAEQKADLKAIFDHRCKSWKSLDYVAGWFMKAADYGAHSPAAAAFVSTNSICQGQQVPILWPMIFTTGHEIAFAHTSFKWTNLASHNAGVTVSIVGISNRAGKTRRLFSVADDGKTAVKDVENINAYLVPAADVVIDKRSKPCLGLAEMTKGNQPTDGGHLLLTTDEVNALGLTQEQRARFIRRIYGSAEFIRGLERYCLWISNENADDANSFETISRRFQAVSKMRLGSTKSATVALANSAHKFGEIRQIGNEVVMAVPKVSSESREYLPVGILSAGTIVSDLLFAIFDAPLWNMALIASRLHLVWIGTVCGKLETRYRYSNTLGWNTFPVPLLTEQNKADLTACAENILLAREAHFPATIADLYDPDTMPENLRHAHERNDEVLERIYIGRRFKNDTERLEKLFELYTRMTAGAKAKPAAKTAKGKKA